jgi:hypothetical protein
MSHTYDVDQALNVYSALPAFRVALRTLEDVLNSRNRATPPTVR